MWSVVQDHVNGNLLFAGTEFGAVHQRRRRRALDAAQGRHADDAGARHDGPEARERPRARDVRPRLLRARRLQRAARDRRRRRSRTTRSCYPLRDAYIFAPTGLAPRGHRRHRSDGRQLDGAEPAVRRGVHLQREGRTSGGREARADDHRRRPANRSAASTSTSRPACAGSRGTCAAIQPPPGGRAPAGARRRIRRPRRATRRRWSRPAATAPRWRGWPATRSRRSARRSHFRCCRSS